MQTAPTQAKYNIDLVLLVVLTLFLLAFYAPWLANKASFFLFDNTYGWEPLSSYLSRSIAGGRFPLWNPYIVNGTSVVAISQPSLTFPLNWLFVLLPFNSALALLFVVNHFIAAVGAYLVILELGWGRRCAVFSATMLSLCSTMFSLQTTNPIQSALAWFPLAIWALLKVERGFQYVIIAASAIFICITSGSVEIPLIELCLMGILTVAKAVKDKTEPGKSWLRPLSLRVLAVACGLLLAAPQILPLAEWSTRSPRTLGLSFQEVFNRSLNWSDVINIILPSPFGDAHLFDNPFLGLITELEAGRVPFIKSSFLGPIILTLAAWGFADKRWPLRFFLMSICVVSLTVALGKNIPWLAAFIYQLKLNVFRAPIKASIVFVFCLMFAAVRGLRVLQTDTPSRSANGICLAAWIVIFAGGTLFSPSIIDALAAGMPIPPSAELTSMAATALSLQTAPVALIGILLCLLGYKLPALSTISRERLADAAIVCTAIAFGWQAFVYFHNTGPADFFTRPQPLADLIKSLPRNNSIPRFAPIYLRSYPPTEVRTSEDLTTQLYQHDRQVLTPCLNIDAGIDASLSIYLSQTRESAQLVQAALQQYHDGDDYQLWMFCRMSSTTIATQRMSDAFISGIAQHISKPLNPQRFHLLQTIPKLDLRVYSVIDPFPRAYFAASAKWGAPHDAVMDALCNLRQSGINPAKLTILEHNFPGEVSPQASEGPISATEKIQFAIDQPERIVLQTHSEQARYLVLTDTFYPGWHAFINGKPTKIYRANGNFRAVFVPTGEHTVEFRFVPTSFYIGLGCAVFALLSLIVLAMGSKYAAYRHLS